MLPDQPEAAWQRLIDVAPDVEGPGLAGQRSRPVDQVEQDFAARAGRRREAVLAAERLPGLRVPVVVEGRVLAPRDRPEERVAQAGAERARRGVRRQQEAGRPVVLAERVVHHRQIEERHALDAHDGAAEQDVVVQHHRQARPRDRPALRRLDAGREAAVLNLVPLVGDAFQPIGPEMDLGLLGAEQAARFRAPPGDLRGAVSAVEHAELRRVVELDAIGGDADARLFEGHAAARLHDLILVRPLDLVGVERDVVAPDHDVAAGDAVRARDLVDLRRSRQQGPHQERHDVAVPERVGRILRRRGLLRRGGCHRRRLCRRGPGGQDARGDPREDDRTEGAHQHSSVVDEERSVSSCNVIDSRSEPFPDLAGEVQRSRDDHRLAAIHGRGHRVERPRDDIARQIGMDVPRLRPAASPHARRDRSTPR